MKRLIAGVAVCAGVALSCMFSTPKAHAEQGYARIDYIASTQQVTLGDQFTVAMYITGRDNTQYGRVAVTVEAWTPGDLNPPVGYEFVGFTPGSDFPINNSQGVVPGQYGTQCRTYDRSAPANLTGRHLFGTATYRAVSNHWAGYSFQPFMTCSTNIEDPAGNWGIIWDYGGAFLTVKNPATATPSTPTGSSTGNSSTAKATGTANTNTNQNTTNTTSGQAVLSDSTATAPNTQAGGADQAGKPATPHAAQYKTIAAAVTSAHTTTKIYWALTGLLPIAVLTFVLWKTNKLPRLSLRRK